MRALIVSLALLAASVSTAAGQVISQSGFVEGRGFAFPQEAPNDSERLIGDFLAREEVFLRPGGWLRLAAGIDLRANSHDQVENEWRLDLEDRSIQRPRAAVRRLAATISTGGFTLDLGKQFIRWGRADVIFPTDRFAPRDYLNVVDTDLLPVIAARASLQVSSETFEAIWVPQLTPSRLPLFDQRWAPVPPEPFVLQDDGSELPAGRQYGVRWKHTGSRLETALMFFDGFNHQPDLELRSDPVALTLGVRRVFPAIRMYGGDIAIPTGWLTFKGEVAYVTSPDATSDEYVLYVVEIERQAGEWLLDVGYAGEVVRDARAAAVFAPDRLMARSVIGRAAYTLDPRRTVIVEGAVRQTGEGFYGKIEYSQALTQYLRLTLTGVGLGGDQEDFLGQYQRNSHGSVTLRFSF